MIHRRPQQSTDSCDPVGSGHAPTRDEYTLGRSIIERTPASRFANQPWVSLAYAQAAILFGYMNDQRSIDMPWNLPPIPSWCGNVFMHWAEQSPAQRKDEWMRQPSWWHETVGRDRIELAVAFVKIPNFRFRGARIRRPVYDGAATVFVNSVA